MNKMELIEAVALRSGISSDGARRAVEALFGRGDEAGLIAVHLRSGEKVQLAGFGTFLARQRKERTGRNPHTRQPLLIPAALVAAFRPAAALRDQLRSGRNGDAPARVPNTRPA